MSFSIERYKEESQKVDITGVAGTTSPPTRSRGATCSASTT